MDRIDGRRRRAARRRPSVDVGQSPIRPIGADALIEEHQHSPAAATKKGLQPSHIALAQRFRRADDNHVVELEERRILEERLADYDANPDEGSSWEETEARILRSFGNQHDAPL